MLQPEDNAFVPRVAEAEPSKSKKGKKRDKKAETKPVTPSKQPKSVEAAPVKESKPSSRKVMNRIKRGAEGTATAAKGYLGMKVAMAIKKFMAMLEAMAQSVASAASAVAAAVMNVVTTIATALSIGVAAAAVISIGGAVLALVVVGALILGNLGNVAGRVDGTMRNCAEELQGYRVELDDGTQDSLTHERAQKIYSVFHQMGFTDESIAGILGNWVAESGIQPYTVEGSYLWGNGIEAKKQAEADWNDYTLNKLFPAYDRSGVSINRSAYIGSDGLYYPGLGLGGWTGPRTTSLLNFARGYGEPWYGLDTQLAFILTPNANGGDYSRMKSYGEGTYSSPEEAVDAFMTKWEGLPLSEGSHLKRQQAAAKYYAYMQSDAGADRLVADTAYGNSIIAKAGAVTISAGDKATAAKLSNCMTSKYYDNSSAAKAAVSFAYATRAESLGNDGTALYRTVVDGVRGGATKIYQSCDRCVASAIRWSGTDDSYPMGNVSVQMAYVTSSSKWTEVPYAEWHGDRTLLLPGDVLIRDDDAVGHTVMYVGEDLVQQYHGDNAIAGSCVVSASYEERSAGCGIWYQSGADGEGYNTYRVFRNTQKETNSQYTSVASHVAPSSSPGDNVVV